MTKRYGAVTAVSDLCLEVSRGRLVGFLGPNGAGKSTTIGCLAGITDPTVGTVRIFGERLTGNSVGLKRRIGVMPERLALFEHLTAGEFLTFNARMYGLDRVTVRRRVDELIEVFELAGALRRPLVEYSTGMRRKVAFGAAIIHRPELLLLDEPFASVDPSTVAMLKRWLRHFTAQGRTVFLSSHALETVERLCDEIAIIEAGRLAWHGVMHCRAAGPEMVWNGQTFRSLEELYIAIIGERGSRPEWL